jgi:hypothetical protein
VNLYRGLLAAGLMFATPLASALEGAQPSHVRAETALEDVRPETTLGPDGLYDAIGLNGHLDRAVFDAALKSVRQHGLDAHRLAIADMSQPSTARRLFVLDLDTRQILAQTYVAHGQNSGNLMANRFSNRNDSHQTSLGLYRVGSQISSPKHGAALLLDGLDAGVNDRAREREIIVHGADYVSEKFIAANGRLGRSWGCPSVPREAMPYLITFLADGGLLYVHG